MDVSVLRPPLDLSGVELITLVEEDCVACLPSTHRLASAKSVSIYDLLEDPIVAAPGSGAWRSYADLERLTAGANPIGWKSVALPPSVV
jgi:DNA-binding transcriptional LysR family regulator